VLGPEEETVSAAAVIAPTGGTNGVIRSIGLNTVYQIGSQVAPAVAAIAAIPFLLRHLGYDVFGIVTIFSTMLAYFAMLDLGLGRAATRFISQSLEAERPDDVRRYFWGSVILLSAMGAIVTVGCVLSVPAVVGYLKISTAYFRAAKESFYVICLTIPIVTLTATLRGFLEASGRFRLVSIVTGSGGVGAYVLPALAVAMGGGLVAIAAVFAGVRIAMCGALALGCLSIKQRPCLRPVFDVTAVRRMLSFGGWLSVSNIIGTATIYCDRFLLGMWVGMAAVTSYGMPLDLISRLQLLITSFCTVLFPLMSRLDASGSNQFQTLYRGAVAAGLSVMTPLAATAVMVAPVLMKLWLGQRITSDAVFAAQVFLAGAVAQSIASIAWTALHARGRSDLTAWLHLAEFPLYCGVFYLAATHFGVRGAALAWLGRGIADFLCMVLLLRAHRKGHGFSMPPELVAAIVSVGILLIAILPLRDALIMAVLVSTLTWVWIWRTMFDPPMRIQLARVLLGRRTARPVC
jgi:O-antigen/teichoic acid export membrane protein